MKPEDANEGEDKDDEISDGVNRGGDQESCNGATAFARKKRIPNFGNGAALKDAEEEDDCIEDELLVSVSIDLVGLRPVVQPFRQELTLNQIVPWQIQYTALFTLRLGANNLRIESSNACIRFDVSDILHTRHQNRKSPVKIWLLSYQLCKEDRRFV